MSVFRALYFLKWFLYCLSQTYLIYHSVHLDITFFSWESHNGDIQFLPTPSPLCNFYLTFYFHICYKLHNTLLVLLLKGPLSSKFLKRAWKQKSSVFTHILFLMFFIPFFTSKFSSGTILLLPGEFPLTFLSVWVSWWWIFSVFVQKTSFYPHFWKTFAGQTILG